VLVDALESLELLGSTDRLPESTGRRDGVEVLPPASKYAKGGGVKFLDNACTFICDATAVATALDWKLTSIADGSACFISVSLCQVSRIGLIGNGSSILRGVLGVTTGASGPSNTKPFDRALVEEDKVSNICGERRLRGV
jgi:hypothetical protein